MTNYATPAYLGPSNKFIGMGNIVSEENFNALSILCIELESGLSLKDNDFKIDRFLFLYNNLGPKEVIRLGDSLRFKEIKEIVDLIKNNPKVTANSIIFLIKEIKVYSDNVLKKLQKMMEVSFLNYYKDNQELIEDYFVLFDIRYRQDKMDYKFSSILRKIKILRNECIKELEYVEEAREIISDILDKCIQNSNLYDFPYLLAKDYSKRIISNSKSEVMIGNIEKKVYHSIHKFKELYNKDVAFYRNIIDNVEESITIHSKSVGIPAHICNNSNIYIDTINLLNKHYGYELYKINIDEE